MLVNVLYCWIAVLRPGKYTTWYRDSSSVNHFFIWKEETKMWKEKMYVNSKKSTSTSFGCMQHPKAGQNTQYLMISVYFLDATVLNQ